MSLTVRRAATEASDAEHAVEELAQGLDPDAAVIFCFVSPRYDLDALGAALASRFPDTCVVGATTSGQIGSRGFQPVGIVATSVGGPLRAEAFVIEPLDQTMATVARVSTTLQARLDETPKGEQAFGFLLVDGLSMREERLASALYTSVARLPVIGGSAGDDLGFVKTHVYANGRFRQNAAVLTLVRTPLPFVPVKVMHHVPTDQKMVITAADPEQRIVYEINGRPAAEAYAEMVGVTVEELGPEAFSKHPVMLRIGSEHYIRSIQQIEDGAIRFYCAIERGLVLTLAKPARVMESLQEAFRSVEKAIGPPSLVLGCDCILRRLELEDLGMAEEVGAFFAEQGVVGFSTYGEQIDGLHVNQTFTGIALGGAVS
ncbi:MAG: FIST N-terminal domain-containing protein [Myxococcota bacterium]